MKHTKTFTQLTEEFSAIYEWFNSLSALELSSTDRTAHIIVDMVNGFVKQGAMSSSEVLSINCAVADFTAECKTHAVPNLALCDMHTTDSVEFQTYPVHCLKGTAESKLTDEIQSADGNISVFGKNSTNGWLENDFRDAVSAADYHTFILSGDCTDICVLNLALTMKADFDRRNVPCRIIVPYDLTATCTLPNHDPELAEIMALFMMKTNGIEVVKTIAFQP